MNLSRIVFLTGPTPASFLFIFVLFKHTFYRKNCRLQRDSNLDRWNRRQERWPLDHHHHGPLSRIVCKQSNCVWPRCSNFQFLKEWQKQKFFSIAVGCSKFIRSAATNGNVIGPRPVGRKRKPDVEPDDGFHSMDLEVSVAGLAVSWNRMNSFYISLSTNKSLGKLNSNFRCIILTSVTRFGEKSWVITWGLIWCWAKIWTCFGQHFHCRKWPNFNK